MRQERTVQASLFDLFADHEIGRELKAMSQWLDEHRALIGLAAEDLRRHGVKETGREGLPAESVLRCAILKQHRQLSYEELAFHLEDSASFPAFARLPLSWTPKKSVLDRTISAIRAETWEAINRALLASARQEKIETGTVVRFDSTVLKSAVTPPRVMITDKLRSYGAARAKMGLRVDHRQHKGLNNRAENSHQPTRRRERIMKRFKSARQPNGFCRFTIRSPMSSTSLVLTPSGLTPAALRASKSLRLGARSPRRALSPDLASQKNRLSSARRLLNLTMPLTAIQLTQDGRHHYAIGGSAEASRPSG